jgi:hypothetical protein
MDSNEFIDGLKRDKARGNLAPHQIILLLALLNLDKENNSSVLDIFSLNNEFQKVWNEHQDKFESKNNKIGLPLKAFVNKGYIELVVSNTIKDLRSNSELESKISNLKIGNELLKLFSNDSIKKYLISRISI